MSSSAASPTLVTAEEFARLPDDGNLTELVRGKLVRMPPPAPFHGLLCIEIAYLIRHFWRLTTSVGSSRTIRLSSPIGIPIRSEGQTSRSTVINGFPNAQSEPFYLNI